MSTAVCASPEQLPAGFMLAGCAVSGGTLEEGLGALMEAAGGRLAVELRPLRLDFALPCPAGAGEILTVAQLQALFTGQSCHTSRALCADYFTFAEGDTAHVALYDTAESLREKYRVLEKAGVPYVVIRDPGLRALLVSKNPSG